MSETIHILGISGSLRKDSYNTAALRAAIGLNVEGVEFDVADISQIPLYNYDVQAQGFPEPVQKLQAQILKADAILIVTPEYNYSIPGVLKNAIDWASRLPDSPLAGKALGIMGASMGPIGTARAQYHLRQTAVFLDMHPVNKPEVMIGVAQNKFDADGNLTDDATREFILKLVVALRDWSIKLKKS